MTSDLSAISALQLHNSGVQFLINVETIHGGMDIAIPLNLLSVFLQDRDEGIGRSLGGTGEEYRQWLACHGACRCAGTNVKGEPCGALIKGMTCCSFKVWREWDRAGYCSYHE